MATPQEVLLGILEDLGANDFTEFKRFLQQQGPPAIPKSRLENADRMSTVDQMVQNYSRETINVTRMVLEKMNQSDLLEKLSNTISEPTQIQFTMQQDTNSV